MDSRSWSLYRALSRTPRVDVMKTIVAGRGSWTTLLPRG
jgi:hypothetical protein